MRLIAEYNAALGVRAVFTDRRSGSPWPARPGRDVYEGHTAIPTGNPKRPLHGGREFTIESAAGDSARGPHAPLAEIDPAPRSGPVAASETAEEVDAMFNFIMYINYFFAALIAVLMVVFCVKYRRRPGVRADQSITHNTPLEIFWSVVPTILVAIMFWGGYKTFLDMRTSPPDAMQIYVKARQWGWDFTYTNGVETAGEFHVPANTPIEMVMTSNDVLHSFHLPAFRQKSDVLPNRYTKVWFDSGEPRTYRVYCSEYCGTGTEHVLESSSSPRDYEAWLRRPVVVLTGRQGAPRDRQAHLRARVQACHSIDGKITGPTFAGLWGPSRSTGRRQQADRGRGLHPQSIPIRTAVVSLRQMSIYSHLPEPRSSECRVHQVARTYRVRGAGSRSRPPRGRARRTPAAGRAGPPNPQLNHPPPWPAPPAPEPTEAMTQVDVLVAPDRPVQHLDHNYINHSKGIPPGC